MNIYIIPQVDKTVKYVCDNGKTKIDDDGNIVITQKMTPTEIAELFDVSISDVLSGNLRIGMYTLWDKSEQNGGDFI